MEDLLISKAEVIQKIAEGKNLKEIHIPKIKIEVCEEAYLRPVLGDKLTDKLKQLIKSGEINVTSNLKYKKLLNDHVKDAMAFYVKHEILPDIYAQITNTGVMRNRTNHSESSSVGEVTMLRQNALSNANILVNRMKRFLESGDYTYDEYNFSENRSNTSIFPGGLILDI